MVEVVLFQPIAKMLVSPAVCALVYDRHRGLIGLRSRGVHLNERDLGRARRPRCKSRYGGGATAGAMIVCCWVPPSDHEEKRVRIRPHGLIARLERAVEADQRVVDELAWADPSTYSVSLDGAVLKVDSTFVG